MQWQDIVLSVGSWVFIAALIPTILGTEKPALSSSVLTGLVLAVFAGVYGSLGLWTSALSAAALSAGWWVLAWQKYRAGRMVK